jgi:hypothetical protein
MIMRVAHLVLEGQLHHDRFLGDRPLSGELQLDLPGRVPLARDLCERFLDHVIDELILEI